MTKIGVCGGIINENFQSPVGAGNMLKNGVNLRHVTNVTGECFGFTAGGNNFINHPLAALNPAAGDNNVSALFGEEFGNGFADASTSASHQSNSAR